MQNLTSILVFVVIFILVSAFKSSGKPKKAAAKTQQPPRVPQHNVQPRMMKPEVHRDDFLPRATTTAAPTAVPLDVPRKAYIPTTPSEEGVHAVAVNDIAAEDAYAEPHPDVPVAADWRRAIIAHEILKTKF